MRGFVETVYDESDGSVGNLDNIFEGGAATGEIASGITYADIDLSFTIPDDGNCTYDSLTSQVHVYDGDDEIGVIDLSGLLASSGENTSSVSGESIFPITVKDSDGNLYSLEPETDTPVDSSGNTPLKVRKVGSSGGALPEGSVFYDRLDGEIGLVTFRDVDGSRYEFDTWNPVYSGSLLIRDKYERLDRDYYVPCKLLPSGASDRVVAHLEIRGSDVDPNKIKFLTRQGTEYVPESFNAESGDYILSLVGGKENDGQELYALYPKPDSGYYNLGKLLILSYPSYSFPVKIVSVGGGLPAEEFSALRQNLENLFSRYGIRCDVSYDETVYSDLQMFDKGSGLLSAYNSRMKAFNRHYASTRELDEGCSYLFVFPESGYKRNRDFSGFMPRNCQFGYVFRQDFTGFDSFCLAVAHELCHGRLSLKHIFDNSYGLSEGDLAENLMDYRDGSHLAKWQWDLIHDPGVVVRIFERDKDAAIQGAFYDGIAFAPLVDYKYHYDFGNIYSVEARSGDELTCGRYNLTAHYNIDHDNTKKLSYYLAWCEVLKGSGKQYRTDYYIGANRLNEFKEKINLYSSAADIFFMNGVPPQSMLQVLNGLEIGDLSEVLGGLGDMWGDALSDPMWWINIVNGSVSPKFLKPASKFMGSFIQGLGDGAISLLNKTGRLGYKIKYIAGEVALYTNLEIEIARFNSRGILRPLYWGEAVGEKVLSLENELEFAINKDIYIGKPTLYTNGGKYFWNCNDKILVRYKVSFYDDIKLLPKDNSLPKLVQETFLDNYYYTAEARKSIKVYRRFGGENNQAKLLGNYASTITTLSRSDLAILKKWSNMQFEVEIIVEKGAKLNLGKIAPQQGYRGGADQILLPLDYPRSWISKIIDLKTKNVYTLEDFEKLYPDQIK